MKVEIVLRDGSVMSPDFTGLKIIEKLAHGQKELLGTIVSIEAEIEIPNVNGELSIENPISRLKDVVGAGTKLIIDDMELIVTEWNAPLSKNVATIRAIDYATYKFETGIRSHRLARNVYLTDAIKRFWNGYGFDEVNVVEESSVLFPYFWATDQKDWDDLATSFLIAAVARSPRKIDVFSLRKQLRSTDVVIDTFENAPELFSLSSNTDNRSRIEYTERVDLDEVKQIAKVSVELAPLGSSNIEIKYKPALFTHFSAANHVNIEIINVGIEKTSAIVYNRTKEVYTGEVEAYGHPLFFEEGSTGEGSFVVLAPFVVGKDVAETLRRNIDGWITRNGKKYSFRVLLDNPLFVGDSVVLRSRYVDTYAIVVESENVRTGDGWIVGGVAAARVSQRVYAPILPFFFVDAEV